MTKRRKRRAISKEDITGYAQAVAEEWEAENSGRDLYDEELDEEPDLEERTDADD